MNILPVFLQNSKHPIEAAINNFTSCIEGLRASTPLIEQLIDDVFSKHGTSLDKEMSKYGQILEKDDEEISYSILMPHVSNSVRLIAKLQEILNARLSLPNMFLLTLVSQYDAFIADLFKSFLQKKPELVSASQKSLSFSEISEFESIEEIKNSIINDKVENLIRESHTKQFDNMEKLFDVKLRSGLDIWSDFIEVTERRNLLAHTNGIVTRQYVSVCKRNGVAKEKIQDVGEKLSFSPQYFSNAYNVFFEISTKLAHVLWRKMFPNELEMSDSHYNNVCYRLLKSKNYDVAIKLLDFICDEQKKHSSDNAILHLKFNRCNAYRLANQQDRCIKFLDLIDTSALGIEFKLVEAVLRNQFDTASEIMRIIGKTNDAINQFSYSDWPIFEGFRESNEFLETYEEIFNEPFIVTQSNNLDDTFRNNIFSDLVH